jgi:Holliday junction DNA helicase RuvA
MIAGLKGIVHGVTGDAVLVDVQGVIYRVMTSGQTLADAGDVGDRISVVTHLVVREDAMVLYGFLTEAELTWFQTLIGVSGVGPRLACAILTKMTPDVLLEAISQERVDLLSTVPGVGKRTASRLVLELRGKLPADIPPSGRVPSSREALEVVEALQALGYSIAEARQAAAQADAEATAPVEERLVAALRNLATA